MLRSVVAIEVSPINDDIIIGTTALIKTLPSEASPIEKYLHYNPRSSALVTEDKQSPDPVTLLDAHNEMEMYSFIDLVKKYGTIFIYQNPEDIEAFTTSQYP
jgi:hypothetical protein